MDTNQDRVIAANDLAAAVVKMLSTSYTHKEIKDIVRTTVLEEAANLPSRRVIYNSTHGGFGFSDHFDKYLAKYPATDYTVEWPLRDDCVIIQAVADFGREICTKFPFILEDLKTVEKWKLQDLMSSDVAAEPSSNLKHTLNSDLAMRLASFHASPRPSRHDSNMPFINYVETHPETWMLHPKLPRVQATGKYQRNLWIAALFAHQLLHDAPETYRDPSTGDIDAQVYDSIGLAGASDRYSALRLATVPAMVDYTINEYDGLENVEF